MKTTIIYIILVFCIIALAGCYCAIRYQFKIIDHSQAISISEATYRDNQEKLLLHRIERLEYIINSGH